MNLSSYLHKRPNSARWQLRWMVPIAARAAVGKREFTKSLGVTDRREAAELALPILLEWKRRVAAVSGGEGIIGGGIGTIVPSAADLEKMALEIGFAEASRRADILIRQRAQSPSGFEALQAKLEAWHTASVRRMRAGDHGYWIEKARRAVRRLGWDLPSDTLAFQTFAENVGKAGIDTFGRAVASMKGDESKFVPSSFVTMATQRRAARAAPGERVLELFECYAAQRMAEGVKRPDGIDQDRVVASTFAEFVGLDRSLRSVEQTEVREWRNTIAALPPAYRKRKAFAGLSIRETAKKARAAGERGLTPTTVNRYLSTISALFSWARKEGYAELNPCDSLFYNVQKGKNPRPPFSVDQMNVILRSPLFTGFERDGKEHKAGSDRASDWRFWIPLICIFTGARIGEVAQLRIDDIRLDSDYPHFIIAHEEKGSVKTKAGVTRIAAIHSTLLRLGLGTLREKRLRSTSGDGSLPLFDGLSRNDRGQFAKPSRFWRAYLKNIGIKSDRDGYGSHSFRHLLADELRRGDLLDNEVALVLGHRQKTVTSNYGRTPQGTLRKLKELIECAQFEGVSFNHLYMA